MVDVCPQNQTEWQEASKRLNCSDDAKSPKNKYHCLPVHNLTSLLEFCYSEPSPQVVIGKQETNFDSLDKPIKIK